MKTIRNHALVLTLIFSLNMEGQEIYRNQIDPLINFVMKANSLGAFSYDAVYREKSLFSDDTLIRRAKVYVNKINDKLIFLSVFDSLENSGLLFDRDTVWTVNHSLRQKNLAGTGAAAIKGHRLGQFYPLALFGLDSSVLHLEPYWRVTGETDKELTVTVQISNLPAEVTEARYELSFCKADSLVYRTLEDVEFGGYGNNHYQERIFSNYLINDALSEEDLAHQRNYQRKIMNDRAQTLEIIDSADNREIVYLGENLRLLDISGSPYTLPQEGFILMDLWYAGCYPCIKAAPTIEKLFREYGNDIHFYAVNEVDRDIERIEKFKESLGISFPVLLNRGESIVLKVNGNNAYPAYFILEAGSGKVIWKDSGYSEETEQKLRSALKHITGNR